MTPATGAKSLRSDSLLIEQRLLLVADSRDDYIPGLMMQLGISLRYSKIPAETFDLSTAHSLPDLSRFSSILVLSPASDAFMRASLNEFYGYVNEGGSLTFLTPTLIDETSELLGIVNDESRITSRPDAGAPDEEVHSIRFASDRYLGLEDATLRVHDVTNKMTRNPILSADAMIDAYFVYDGSSHPAIWHRAIGLGEVCVWTFVPTGRHWGRSFLIHAAIQGQVIAVKSIANSSVFQIDDFPAPESDEQVMVEPGVRLPWREFIERYWRPDLATLAEENRILFSCGVVLQYNERTHAPFGFEEWESQRDSDTDTDPGSFLDDVNWARERGELGLHGYNHVPITLREWPTRSDIVESLRVCLSWLQREAKTDPPTSYIPPMNIYDQDGAIAITEACPSIRALCGNFWGSAATGGGREFSPEQWNRRLFCVPRVTSGYFMSESLKWKMLASLYELGTWTHFIHPDDILDVPCDSVRGRYCRNPESRSWRGSGGFRSELERMLNFVRVKFPWLCFDTATDSAMKISGHMNNQIRCRLGRRRIVVDSDQASHLVVFARGTNRKLSEIDNSAVVLSTSRSTERTVFTIRIESGCTTATLSN